MGEVFFRIALGGATGHKAFARDLGVLVKPAELNKIVAALVRVFIEHGNRSDRKRARLKHLLETWTLEHYLGEAEKLLGHTLLRAPLQPGQLQYSSRAWPHCAPGRLRAEAERAQLHRGRRAGRADHSQANAAGGGDRRALRLR